LSILAILLYPESHKSQEIERMQRKAVFIIILILLTSLALAQDRGLEPEDFYNEVTISQTALSPDGSYLAFTVMTIVEDKNKRHSEIWMQKLADGKPDGEAFRFTDPTRESSSPKWSPCGKLISFSSSRGDDKNGLWFMRVTAPGGEAFHIDGVDGSPVWSPDGKWIAFSKKPVDEEEKEIKDKRKGWVAADAKTNTLDAKRFDGRVITSIRYKRDGSLTLLPDPSIRKKNQIFVVSSSGGEAKQLTNLAFDPRGLAWTPDGKNIFFSGDRKQDDELNRDFTSELFTISLKGGEPVAITDNTGSERSFAFSPDGKKLAYTFSAKRGDQSDILVVAVKPDGTFAGESKNLTAKWDYSPGSPAWTADSKQLRFSTGYHGNSHIFLLDESSKITKVTSGDRTIRSISTDEAGKLLAYSVTTPTMVSELFLASADGSNEQQLTNFNESWLKEVKLETPERLTWKVADGTEIEGWLLKPLNFDPAKSYPMIQKIHGGPHGAYGNYWFRTFHVLSNDGFFVLYTNPRGSSSYGHDYTYATKGDWGLMDTEDFFNGIDLAMAKYPQIDGKRLGVSGGSYGGFMSNWLTATSDRFAASVTSRSIVNWESWYGTSEAQGLTEYEFFGTPWEKRELYRKLSPISYVENVTAPTLIIHSENDSRTPIGDGEQWFMALKKMGVPVEMVRYPRSSHGLSRDGEPWLLVDRLERLSTWFQAWLLENPEAK
jgi:dipeptidyl aminopeptidase/acylaminoacyl peptidase